MAVFADGRTREVDGQRLQQRAVPVFRQLSFKCNPHTRACTSICNAAYVILLLYALETTNHNNRAATQIETRCTNAHARDCIFVARLLVTERTRRPGLAQRRSTSAPPWAGAAGATENGRKGFARTRLGGQRLGPQTCGPDKPHPRPPRVNVWTATVRLNERWRCCSRVGALGDKLTRACETQLRSPTAPCSPRPTTPKSQPVPRHWRTPRARTCGRAWVGAWVEKRHGRSHEVLGTWKAWLCGP